MIMKFASIILCFIISVTLSAQDDILDLERYNSLSTNIYIDNLSQNISCSAFQLNYYSHIPASKYDVEQIISQDSKLREVLVHSPKARNGYLYVNETLNKILDGKQYPQQLLYVYNDVLVTSKKEVMRIVRLRKKQIKALIISHNDKNNEIIAYIYV